MKHLFLSLIAFFLLFPAANAQEKEAMSDKMADKIKIAEIKPAAQSQAEREALSKQMHEIWPVRPKVESAIDLVGEQAPEAERARFKAAMRKAMDFEALEAKSIATMAEIFTVAELEKMIEFYGSPEGRSVSFKTGDYETALQPFLIEMVDKALLDTRLGQ